MINLFNYTKHGVIILSFIITCIIFFIINSMYNAIIHTKTVEIAKEKVNNKEIIVDNEKVWQIEIPKIDLVAPIADGIDSKIINNYVGHFPSTSLLEGNIGLAAHNRRI